MRAPSIGLRVGDARRSRRRQGRHPGGGPNHTTRPTQRMSAGSTAVMWRDAIAASPARGTIRPDATPRSGTGSRSPNIPGYVIGKIRIEEKVSFVDIPEDVVEQVIKHSGNYKIGKEKFSVVKA